MLSANRYAPTAFLLFAMVFTCVQAAGSTEVLVSVGGLEITAADLEKATRSSPFATGFNTLEEQEQAFLRGGLLQRLVASRLLLLEAQARDLDQGDAFRDEMERFRLALLHRRYMDRLRESISIPDATLQRMKEQFKDNPDAFKASQAAYIADEYKQARIQAIRNLRTRYHIRVHEERMLPDAAPESVLLEGDGIRIPYSDLLNLPERKVTKEWIEHNLYTRAELLLTAKAAEEEGIDISAALDSFKTERLPALLLEQLEGMWIPDEAPLQAYFRNHPEIGRILERRHIGQLVTATREEAEKLRKRILDGESLFKLAGEHSIDPYGRTHNGDMGWIKEDRGDPKINAAIADLKDGEVSEIIETPLGFHLVTILERKPGENKPFHLVKDKVHQTYLSERLGEYLRELERKYQVVWYVGTRDGKVKN